MKLGQKSFIGTSRGPYAIGSQPFFLKAKLSSPLSHTTPHLSNLYPFNKRMKQTLANFYFKKEQIRSELYRVVIIQMDLF